MVKLLDRICAFCAYVAMAIVLFITFSVCYAIFARTTGIYNPIWIVQFNEYALLWLTFLGSAWVLARNKHVSVSLLLDRLEPKTVRIFQIIHGVLGIAVCGVLFYYTIGTTWDLFKRGVIDVSSVDVPKAYVISIIPFGLLLLILQFLRNLVYRFKSEVE